MMKTRRPITSASAEIRDFGRDAPHLRSHRFEGRGTRLHSAWLSSGKIAASAVCGILVLTALTLAEYVAYQWFEHDGPRPFDQPVWREPLDNWSL